MKKLSVIFTFASIAIFFCLLPSYTMAEPNVVPPLLLQRQPAAPPPIPEVARRPPAPAPLPVPVPATPAKLPVAPPPPGPGIAQTLPAQSLLKNLPVAVATVQKIDKLLTPGKVWSMQGPAGEIEIKAGVLYQGSVVAVLHFDPLNGSVLPLGIHSHANQRNLQTQAIKTRLASVINELKILPAAEFREPETCWVFPITFGNTIVANLKVYYDGIHIIPDYRANQEMNNFSQ